MKLAERLMLKGKQEGIEEGIHKGKLEGIQEGIHKGKQEGIHKGKLEGKFEGIQENIFDILQMRFSEIPEAFKQRLNKIKDFEQLRVIHKKAVVINSFAELQTVLNS